MSTAYGQRNVQKHVHLYFNQQNILDGTIMIRNIQPKLLGFKSLLCIMDKLYLFLIVHRSTTDCQQCCQMSEQNTSMHAQHTCTCTQTCKRMHTQKQRDREQLRKNQENHASAIVSFVTSIIGKLFSYLYQIIYSCKYMCMFSRTHSIPQSCYLKLRIGKHCCHHCSLESRYLQHQSTLAVLR